MKNKILRKKFKQIYRDHFHFPITYNMTDALDDLEKLFSNECMKVEVETGLKNFQLVLEEITKARAEERARVIEEVEKWLVDEKVHTYSDGKVSSNGFRSEGHNALCSRIRIKLEQLKEII